MTAITVRRATPDEADHLTALMHASSAYRGDYASILAGYRVTPAYVERHQVFVAVEGGHGPGGERLRGFFSLVLEPPELDLIFVADEAQGTGVGRLLVERMLDRAGAYGLAEVRVVSHPPAERFYRRMGARRVGTVAPSPPKIPWERPELRFTPA